MMHQPARRIVGCMTGTSLDGLDTALVEVAGAGWSMRATLRSHRATALGRLAARLEALASGSPQRPAAILEAGRQLGQLHASAIAELLEASHVSPAEVDFVVAHGQTIWHLPDHPTGPMSWQLLDPWPIVQRLQRPVCFDLRQADLVAGGQGAPITPASDLVMYGDVADAVVNLGGICNITTWPAGRADPQQVTGQDVGPCNLLLDGLLRRAQPDQRFDVDGRLAGSAEPDPGLVTTLHNAIGDATAHARTLGRENYDAPWLDGVATKAANHPLPVRLASAVAAVADRLAEALRRAEAQRIVLAGGGARNAALVAALQRCLAGQAELVFSDDHGIACEAREAMAMAVLGALSEDGLPATFSQITGARDPGIAGSWAGRIRRSRADG
jgi:1,6-anhydro-N-acetylmuramate kinase